MLSFFGFNQWTLVMLGDWVELPIVTPEQLIQARKVKYFFTGDLEQKVITNPHFVGLEKHLVSFKKLQGVGLKNCTWQLKAQIVRISHATNIVPKTIWRKVEDDGKIMGGVGYSFGLEREIEYNEEDNWKFPSFETLKTKEGWVHFTPSILKVTFFLRKKIKISWKNKNFKIKIKIYN